MAARPILITAHLISETVGDAPQLDALLEEAMLPHMRNVMASRNGGKHQTEMGITRSSSLDSGGKIPIPLLRRCIGGWNVARCSAPILGPVLSERVVHINRKFDVQNCDLLLPKERTSVSVKEGALKSYHLPRRARLIESVRWFAFGYPKEIRRLLRDTPAIGSETNIGYGRVARWEVFDYPFDYSWFAPATNGVVLMRALPCCDELPNHLLGYRKAFGACISPYWHSQRFTEVVLPC